MKMRWKMKEGHGEVEGDNGEECIHMITDLALDNLTVEEVDDQEIS